MVAFHDALLMAYLFLNAGWNDHLSLVGTSLGNRSSSQLCFVLRYICWPLLRAVETQMGGVVGLWPALMSPFRIISMVTKFIYVCVCVCTLNSGSVKVFKFEVVWGEKNASATHIHLDSRSLNRLLSPQTDGYRSLTETLITFGCGWLFVPFLLGSRFWTLLQPNGTPFP